MKVLNSYFRQLRDDCNADLKKMVRQAMAHPTLHSDPDQWLRYWIERAYEIPAFSSTPREDTTMRKSLAQICAKYLEVVS